MTHSIRTPWPGQVSGRAGPYALWWAGGHGGSLAITAVAVLLGSLSGMACGAQPQTMLALATGLVALLAHGAVRLYSHPGNALPAQRREAARTLALLALGGGVLLASRAGLAFVGTGLACVGVAAVSARGRGAVDRCRQAAVPTWGAVLGTGGLTAAVVMAADQVQRHEGSRFAVLAAVGLGLLAAAHKAAALGAAQSLAPHPAAAGGCAGNALPSADGGQPAFGQPSPGQSAGFGAATVVTLALGAQVWLAAWWWADWLPTQAGWALLAVVPGVVGWAWSLRPTARQEQRAGLVAGMAWAAVAHGLLLSAAYAQVLWLRG